MKITLLGAGNLATQLGLALIQSKHEIVQVFSKTTISAGLLAEKLNSQPVTSPDKVVSGSDIYICALKDDAIQSVLSQLNLEKNTLIVHTAGSVPIDLLSNFTSRYGVFYPLQTFSKNRLCDFSKVPVFIEASDIQTLNLIKDLAHSVSSNVNELSSEDRKYLHLSAVFVCNFVNYLYTTGSDILKKNQLDFKYLIPLIDETAAKIHDMHPLDAQTGPAIRMDKTIINKHLALLSGDEKLSRIYTLLSEGIFSRRSD